MQQFLKSLSVLQHVGHHAKPTQGEGCHQDSLSLQLKVCCLKPLEKQIWPQMVAWHLNMSKALLIENSRQDTGPDISW